MNKKQIAEAMRPNVFDRIITAVAPAVGLRRMKARAAMALAGGYLGARWDRRQTKGWVLTTGNDADGDTIGDLATLRDRSRDLIRNAPLATGAINTVCQSVVGTGLAVQARPDAEALGMTPEEATKWAHQAEREFRLFADTAECDITRTQNFYGLQDLAFRSAMEAGDVFAVLPMLESKSTPYLTKVQLIEADRVENPTGVMDGAKVGTGNVCAGGVELDTNGAPVAYHIRRFHPGSMQGRTNKSSDRFVAFGEKTGRRNVLHVLDRKRVGQTRSAPMLAPVIEPLKQLDKYTEAEIMAAVVSSMFTVFVKTPDGQGLANGLTSQLSAGASLANDGQRGKNKDSEQISMAPGAVVDLMDGDDVTFANPMRPNTAFDGFVTAVLRQVGVALGLPFEVLIKHFTASYSAARAALLEAWRFYMNRRAWIAHVFCQPIYEAWMDEAVASGRISAPGYFQDAGLRRAYQRAEWIGDAPGSIDPVKEVQAAQQRMDAHLTTHAEEAMALTGTVWEEKFPQIVKENKMLAEAGLLPSPGTPSGAPGVQPSEPTQPNQPDKKEQGDLENEAAPTPSVIVNVAPPSVTLQPAIHVETAPLELHLKLETEKGTRTMHLVRDADGAVTGAEVTEIR